MTAKTTEILALNAFSGAEAGVLDPEVAALIERRERTFGAASVLFYRQPLRIVRAEGAYIYAADGRRYLDFYNNVPSVGHCHPVVVEAVSKQLAALNIHARYLHETVHDYAEKLLTTFPRELSNIVFTCTGSESNDLALRVARKVSGGTGFIVTEAAYHGNTAAVTEISPSSYKTGTLPPHVLTIPPPDPRRFRGDLGKGFAQAVRSAIAAMTADGIRPAALIVDTIFSSDGVFADPPGFLAEAVENVRKAGGLFIADEVQPGFGRTGAGLWGFARHGVVPDIVTMGKPMGNGYPVAGLVTRPELLAAFAEEFGYFNTFAASPAAAAAGLAVLAVIEQDNLIENAATIGGHLRHRLLELSKRYPVVSAVRGAGLYIGVEFSRGDRERPAPDIVSALIDGLYDRGILIGAAGPYGNTLKVRPPLCVTATNADELVDGMAEILSTMEAAGRLPGSSV
jgi:4-aminobutyrate aminotransferase-like enzyme